MDDQCQQIEYRLYYHHGDRSKAPFQQQNHHDQIQQDTDNLKHLGKDKVLISQYDGTKDAHRKCKGHIENKKKDHQSGPFQFVDRHGMSEPVFKRVEQHPSYYQSQKSDTGIDNEKHAEHFVLLLLLALGPELGGIADNRIPQSQIENGEIGYHRSNQ